MGVIAAALFDVHGNLPALEAVLAEPDTVAADVVVFGGDLVWGPWPSECLELAESLGDRARFLRGNCETLVLDGPSPQHAWARERLDVAQRARIEAWPRTQTLEIDGLGPALFCHATPRDDGETVSPNAPKGAWDQVLTGVAEGVVVCGHTHLQFELSLDGVRVVSPGSVGAPTVHAVAWWALLGPTVELRKTPYDIESTIDAAAARVPDVSGFAKWLREPPSWDARLAALADE